MEVLCQVAPPSWVTYTYISGLLAVVEKKAGRMPSCGLKKMGDPVITNRSDGVSAGRESVCGCQVAPPSCVTYSQGKLTAELAGTPVTQAVEAFTAPIPIL